MKLKLSLLHIMVSLAITTLVALCGLTVVSAYSIKNVMMEDRKDKIQQIIMGVVAISNNVVAERDKGNLTEDQARQRVLSVIQDFRYDKSGYLFANDYDFCVRAHIKTKRIGTCQKKSSRLNFHRVMKEGNGGGFHAYKTAKAGDNNFTHDKISYVHDLPGLGLYVGTGVYFDDINDKFFAVLWKQGAAALVISFVVLIVGLMIGRNVSASVSTLSARLHKLAGGDTSVSFNIPSIVRDVGDIIEAARIFRNELQRTQQLEQEKLELEKTAELERRQVLLNLADDFDASAGEIVENVSVAVMEMEDVAQKMSSVADQATERAIHVAAAAEEASQNTATVASATEELTASIDEIADQVQKAAQTANQAVEESKAANERVSGLAESVDQIGEVVTLITDIANQTNLLALNATIEAARAGEMGKGFAVVASEVKNLANQTAKATEEISGQITAIQVETRTSVQAIENIGTTIEYINNVSSTIASAVEEQGSATQEISRSVQEASAGTDSVTQNIAQVRTAVEETGELASRVRASSNDLSEMSSKLQQQVGEFLRRIREG